MISDEVIGSGCVVGSGVHLHSGQWWWGSQTVGIKEYPEPVSGGG